MTEASDGAAAVELLAAPSLAGLWRSVSLAANDHLFRQGDTGDALYVIERGELEVYYTEQHGERIALERLGAGQHVGELALLDEGTRSASVVAVRDTELKSLRRSDLMEGLAASPELVSALMSLQSRRLRRSVSYLEILTSWARLVAEGDYDDAQDAIEEHACAADDPDVFRFVGAFTEMVAAVQEREEALRRELRQLRIEVDQTEQVRHVAEITESDFFQSLQDAAADMRARLQAGPEAGDRGHEPDSEGGEAPETRTESAASNARPEEPE